MKVDRQSTGISNLRTYTAHKNNVTVRLESYDAITLILKINNRTQSFDLRTDHSELLCLREVLNNWHKEENENT